MHRDSYFRCGGIAVGDPAAVDDYAHRAACEYHTLVDHLRVARSPLQMQEYNYLEGPEGPEPELPVGTWKA